MFIDKIKYAMTTNEYDNRKIPFYLENKQTEAYVNINEG